MFTGSGSAWTQTAKLTAREGANQFGASVALSGNTALIGAPFTTVNGHETEGAAYVFTESNGTWAQTAKLTASDGAVGALFGASVALSGDTAIVSAEGDSGKAYVFTESNGTWAQTAELTNRTFETTDKFSGLVALSGDTALIGDPRRDGNNALDVGAAYFEGRSNLGLTVSAPQQVNEGQQYISQVIATNVSSVASPAVAVVAQVPAEATYVSAAATQGSCGEASGVVTCKFGAIDGNAGTATASIKLKATGNAGKTISNTASVANATPPLSAGAATVIQESNNPPKASDGTLTTKENKATSGTLKATDPDSDPLTFSIVDKPTHGSVSLDDASTGAYTYTPDNGYNGSDSFTFKANDGQADSNVATVSITVKASGGGGSGGGSGGGGEIGLLGLGLLAMIGLLALLRKRFQVRAPGR